MTATLDRSSGAFTIISASDLQTEADFAADFFGPNWKDHPAHRRICEALVDAQAAVAAFEDAARVRANADLRRRASDMAEKVCLPLLRNSGAL